MFKINRNFIIYVVVFFACSIKFTFAELVNCCYFREKNHLKILLFLTLSLIALILRNLTIFFLVEDETC